MIALAGCVQPSMYPNINGATRRVLDRLGIQMVEADGAGCCGAVRLHLNEPKRARGRPAQHRCLVAAARSRRRVPGDDGLRLRLARGRLRPSAAGRPRLRD
jgi:heterodisulfide reductase subunit B